ncbi:unnamed protein product [Amoebophrya sp. A25]|nr:unnamed protein product [Amoebophrya sp. A25]|eukprot:GSA25T00017424001.1
MKSISRCSWRFYLYYEELPQGQEGVRVCLAENNFIYMLKKQSSTSSNTDTTKYAPARAGRSCICNGFHCWAGKVDFFPKGVGIGERALQLRASASLCSYKDM